MLVGDADAVGVEVGVAVGVAVGVLVGVDVGEDVAATAALLRTLGVLVAVCDCVKLGVGPTLVVEYVVPSLDSWTKASWTYSTLPVPPDWLKQPTANATAPPFVTLVALSSVLIVPCSVPLNAAVGLSTTADMLPATDPSVLNSDTTAEPWKPVGHASVVAQVGCVETGPLSGVSVRLPASSVLAAMAKPAVSSPTPAIMPTVAKATASRRIPVGVRLLALSSLT